MILGRSAAAIRIQTFASTARPPFSRQGTASTRLAARGAVAVGENARHGGCYGDGDSCEGNAIMVQQQH